MKGRRFRGIEKFSGLRVIFVKFADLAPRTANLGTGTLQHFFVGAVFPKHQVFDDFKKTFPLLGGGLLIHAVFEPSADVGAGVIHELGKEHRPRRRQGPTRPPKMNAARVSTDAGHFLVGARLVYRIKRQRDFN